MQIDKNTLNMLLALNDAQLVNIIKTISEKSGLDLSSFNITTNDVKSIRRALENASDEDIRKAQESINNFKKSPLDNKKILLEAQHGGEISGNIFYILKELTSNQEYSSYKIYLTYKPKSKQKILKILNNYNIKNIKLVRLLSFKYMKTVATAKYLFNDNTFLPFFTKREGQVYLNTWHGTPL